MGSIGRTLEKMGFREIMVPGTVLNSQPTIDPHVEPIARIGNTKQKHETETWNGNTEQNYTLWRCARMEAIHWSSRGVFVDCIPC
jgi:hypothetical protein